MGTACSPCTSEEKSDQTTPNIENTRPTRPVHEIPRPANTEPVLKPPAIVSLQSDTEWETEYDSEFQSEKSPLIQQSMTPISQPNMEFEDQRSSLTQLTQPKHDDDEWSRDLDDLDDDGNTIRTKPDMEFEDQRSSLTQKHNPEIMRKHSSRGKKRMGTHMLKRTKRKKSVGAHHKGLEDYDEEAREKSSSSYKEGILKGLTSLVIYLAEEHPALDLMNTIFDNGDSSLLMAVRHKEYEVIVYLLSQGCSPNDINTRTGDTALHIAARGGNTKIIAILLRNGADEWLRNNDGLTAREMSVQFNQPAVADLLQPQNIKLMQMIRKDYATTRNLFRYADARKKQLENAQKNDDQQNSSDQNDAKPVVADPVQSDPDNVDQNVADNDQNEDDKSLQNEDDQKQIELVQDMGPGGPGAADNANGHSREASYSEGPADNADDQKVQSVHDLQKLNTAKMNNLVDDAMDMAGDVEDEVEAQSPKSGDKAKNDSQNSKDDDAQNSNDLADPVENAVDDMADAVEDAVDDAVEDVQELAENLRDVAKETMDWVVTQSQSARGTLDEFIGLETELAQEPVLEGWLGKKSKSRSGWSKRWVGVKQAHLYWYHKKTPAGDMRKQEERMKWNMCIHILTIQDVEAIDADEQRQFSFHVQKYDEVSVIKEYRLRADSEEDRDFWVNGLKKHIHNLKSICTFMHMDEVIDTETETPQ